eukprot:SM000166S02454  [mRNA]  locus=s166:59452:64133:+ [translate_table: standard]
MWLQPTASTPGLEKASPKTNEQSTRRVTPAKQPRERAARRRALGGLGLPGFHDVLAAKGLGGGLVRREVGTVQVNVGLFCNQACAHCHVESSPLRTEMMAAATATKLVELLENSPLVHTVDITGGAPELNPQFRFLVAEARRLGKAVIDRCNLTVLYEPGQEDLVEFLAAHRVQVVASLPCYLEKNVDEQRGQGVFGRSVQAIRDLNAAGYGNGRSGLELHLVYNPLGPTLPPPQAALETSYKRELLDRFGIVFDRLFTITNMPIRRFADQLHRSGELRSYLELLINSFNDAAVGNVMCTNLVSIRWDGAIFDCDFNQQLPLPVGVGLPKNIFELASFDELAGAPVACDAHCFGCTAGQGSSCSGAVAST